MGPKPNVLAVVLCDYVSPGINGKFNLIGTVNGLASAKFPVQVPSLGLFFMANGMPKEGMLSFLLNHEEDGKTSIPLPNLKIANAPDDRNEIFQMGGQMHNLIIPKEGAYRLLTLWNGQQIHSQIVLVKKTGGT